MVGAGVLTLVTATPPPIGSSPCSGRAWDPGLYGHVEPARRTHVEEIRGFFTECLQKCKVGCNCRWWSRHRGRGQALVDRTGRIREGPNRRRSCCAPAKMVRHQGVRCLPRFGSDDTGQFRRSLVTDAEHFGVLVQQQLRGDEVAPGANRKEKAARRKFFLTPSVRPVMSSSMLRTSKERWSPLVSRHRTSSSRMRWAATPLS